MGHSTKTNYPKNSRRWYLPMVLGNVMTARTTFRQTVPRQGQDRRTPLDIVEVATPPPGRYPGHTHQWTKPPSLDDDKAGRDLPCRFPWPNKRIPFPIQHLRGQRQPHKYSFIHCPVQQYQQPALAFVATGLEGLVYIQTAALISASIIHYRPFYRFHRIQ